MVSNFVANICDSLPDLFNSNYSGDVGEFDISSYLQSDMPMRQFDDTLAKLECEPYSTVANNVGSGLDNLAVINDLPAMNDQKKAALISQLREQEQLKQKQLEQQRQLDELRQQQKLLQDQLQKSNQSSVTVPPSVVTLSMQGPILPNTSSHYSQTKPLVGASQPPQVRY